MAAWTILLGVLLLPLPIRDSGWHEPELTFSFRTMLIEDLALWVIPVLLLAILAALLDRKRPTA